MSQKVVSLHVTPTPDRITIEETVQGQPTVRYLVDLRERGVLEGLFKLGWRPPRKDIPGSGMSATILATELTNAFKKDAEGEGCDPVAGLFGPASGTYLRELAAELAFMHQRGAPSLTQLKRHRFYIQGYEIAGNVIEEEEAKDGEWVRYSDIVDLLNAQQV